MKTKETEFEVEEEELPEDYEACGYCGYDHTYEPEEAYEWHINNPCSYCEYGEQEHEDNCPVRGGNYGS